MPVRLTKSHHLLKLRAICGASGLSWICERLKNLELLSPSEVFAGFFLAGKTQCGTGLFIGTDPKVGDSAFRRFGIHCTSSLSLPVNVERSSFAASRWRLR